MTAEKRTRRKYTEDFKRDAVALVTEQGYKISEAAGVWVSGGDLIRCWKRGFEAEASGDRLNSDERGELQHLLRLAGSARQGHPAGGTVLAAVYEGAIQGVLGQPG